jgi:hypothetical protein
MIGPRRPSAQTTAVVLALAEQLTAWRYGNELGQQPDRWPAAAASARAARPPAAPAQHAAATIKPSPGAGTPAQPVDEHRPRSTNRGIDTSEVWLRPLERNPRNTP